MVEHHCTHERPAGRQRISVGGQYGSTLKPLVHGMRSVPWRTDAAVGARMFVRVMLRPAVTAPLDIEFPLKTRGGDATGARRAARDANDAIGRLRSVARAPQIIPFLVGRLLSARRPLGLDVELKSNDRVVGTWSIEVNPRGAGDVYVSQAKANLYVCGSARGDLRATGAFLVVRQWWVRASDPTQLEQLYESLSVATLERLHSLLAGARADDSGEPCSCVLFLVDGRRHDRKPFSLDRLQLRLLEELEGRHAMGGLDLRIAHGRGTGTRPHLVFASTMPASLQSGDSGLGWYGNLPADAPPSPLSLVGEVFIRETVSTENLRWNRRASDHMNLMLREFEALAADRLAAAASAASAKGKAIVGAEAG
jgi:hypothetical protein